MQNLKNSFPEKNDEELKKFRKSFIAILWFDFESLKIFTASNKAILNRVELVNAELLENTIKKKKSLILVTGHYANWEWPAVTLPFHSSHTGTGIYKKLSSAFLISGWEIQEPASVQSWCRPKRLERFSKITKMNCALMVLSMIKVLLIHVKDTGCNFKSGYCHADRSWTICRKYNYPVLYGVITKKRRGYYRMEYRVVCEDPSSMPANEITAICSRINEQIIRSAPEYWLWTHRRWKHKRPEGMWWKILCALLFLFLFSILKYSSGTFVIVWRENVQCRTHYFYLVLIKQEFTSFWIAFLKDTKDGRNSDSEKRICVEYGYTNAVH